MCLARADRLLAGTKASCGCLKAAKAKPPKRPKAEPKERFDADGFRLPDRPSEQPRSVADVTDMATFGRLMALRPMGDGKPGWSARPSPPRGQTMWLCQCKCGNYTVARADRLAYRTTKSCGCGRLRAIRNQINRLEGRLAYWTDETAKKAQVVWEREARDNPNPFRWAEE